MTTPTTPTGKRLLGSFTYEVAGAKTADAIVDGYSMRESILAIEADAKAQERERLAREVEGIDTFGMDDDPFPDDPYVKRGDVLALLADPEEQP